MLATLSVRNLVLIDELTMELDRGFNVMTGETGSGKSMLIDALGLVLGQRARPDMVRSGEREAEVEALFDAPPASRLSAKLEAAGIPCDGEVVIRRTVQAEGRSRAFINGRLCTAGQLADFAPDLCDIASQHESVSLTNPATHLDYLDAFGRLDGERSALATDVEALSAVVSELAAARAAEKNRAEREDFLSFQLQEIDEVDPKAGEEVELETERVRLKHAGSLGSATRSAADRLYEGDGAVADVLARIASDLETATAIDPTLVPALRRIEGARAELSDAARELGRYALGVEANPARLDEIEERLFALSKLVRRHGGKTADLVAHRTAIAKELEALGASSERIAELEQKRDALFAKVSSAARALSRKRRGAADSLADAIGKELAQLGMGRARVIVDVRGAEASSNDAIIVDDSRVGRSGMDRVEFLIAPNQGEEPRPLRRIASGGELSRALLALKRVLAEKGPAGLYVFDEVDAGVGGAVAEFIGRAMADVARHRQVLCITHHAQIAALADAHLVASKTEARGRTTTSVKRLRDSERVDEVARMIGGARVGDAARRAAEDLLGIAARPERRKAK